MPEQPTRIVLYGPSQVPFTEKVRRGLMLKGLEFELREPAGPEDYKRWSPENGLLPVLAVGEERIQDSTAILLRLDELFPEAPLLSSDPIVADQQRQLEDWADESFLWYFSRWLQMHDAPLPTPGADPIGAIRQESGRFGFFRRLAAWLRAGGTWERPETGLLRGIADRLGDLANFLGARPFFYADRASIADLAVYGMLCTLRRNVIPGSEQLLSQRPSLIEFMRRVEHESEGAAAHP